MAYNARWYSPSLGRFTQPDTMVPGMYNPQALNRYSYVTNDPINLVDPSGYAMCGASDDECSGPGEDQKPWNPPHALVIITWDEGEEPDEREKVYFEKEAEVFAAALEEAYNDYRAYVFATFGVEYPKLSRNELWSMLFDGPVVIHFLDGPCPGECFGRLSRAEDKDWDIRIGNDIPTGYINRNVGFITHEIFHVLDLKEEDQAYTNALHLEGMPGRSEGGFNREYSPFLDSAEVAADMAVGWATSVGFNTSDAVGIERQQIMDDNMGRLIFEDLYNFTSP